MCSDTRSYPLPRHRPTAHTHSLHRHTLIRTNSHHVHTHPYTGLHTCTHMHPLPHTHLLNLQTYTHGTHSLKHVHTQIHRSRCSALKSEHFGEGPSSGLTFPQVSYRAHCPAGGRRVSEKACCGLLEFSTAQGRWRKATLPRGLGLHS